MFYQCPKCKIRWQFPVKQCAHCLLEVEPMASKEAKVIGISECQLPSMMHPQVPYFVLALQDEHGNIWEQKSEKQYEIGDKYEVASGGTPNDVAIWRNKYDDNEAVAKIFDLLNLEVSEQSKILIVPQLTKSSHPYFRDNTDPDFLGAIIEILKERGVSPSNILVGAQSFGKAPLEAMAQKAGILETCLKEKVMPMDLEKQEFVEKDGLKVCSLLNDVNMVLNLTTLKDLSENTRSNLKSLVLKGQGYQIENLQKQIPNLVNIVDGNYYQHQDGTNSFLGICLGGRDGVLTDLAAQNILSRTTETSGLNIVGRSIAEVKEYLK